MPGEPEEGRLTAIGGLIGLRDEQLHASCEANLIATEGFSTCGPHYNILGPHHG